jgi:ketosteroid isomerase-like protein
MHRAIFIFCTFLCSLLLLGQDADYQLRSELESLHARWFKAFDAGDGATLDQMEVEKLIVVMPDGSIWRKPGPRAGKQRTLNAHSERTLTDVVVRRFGDTAILTGVLASKLPNENTKEAETVLFVQSSGQWKIASAQWTHIGNTK